MESKIIPEALLKGYVPVIIDEACNIPSSEAESLKNTDKKRPIIEKASFWMCFLIGLIIFTVVSYSASIWCSSKPITIESEINLIFGEFNVSQIIDDS